MSVVTPAYNSTATEMSAVTSAKPVASTDSSLQAASAAPEAASTVMSEGDTPLPEKVAYVPETRPGAAFPAVAVPAGATSIAGNTPQPLVQPAQTADETKAAAEKVATGDAAAVASQAQTQAAPVMNNGGVYVTAGDPAQQPIAAPKKGLFASLFSTTPASAAPAPLINNARSGDQPTVQAKTTPPPAKPIVTLASATPGDKPVQLASLGDDSSNHITGADALPGVRQTALFEIKRKSGIDDESDVDLNEDEGGGSYQVASAAGMARLAPNGLLKQNEGVDVACLKPSLVRVLKTIEGHFGRKMIVTSGYRDPSRNRRANGAKNSLHMYCAAADIQVPGVSKWELANYVRSMPGRGGVGTYCHTESIHVDVGPERDWNWRCRRRGGGGEDG
ncbi:D-Ala-D-Ala carboxypeptidase family metallohydrolase [Mesorhizobium sp. VK23B]|uniref:D-Ala-D-Ala carboxypeptidase family metallohydrolase n=2 Tax=Mesorhizobium dulcispinae TaxID=3072316 RepID=A0ABU4XQ68_9HYPH|nr:MULTISPECIES: D-Ala-D-Ala carboxypeptidase family metallohydrolase [unclassified Mesorhizobium]MDX8469613.1 D-Ala-D-Ala carboxypeptidase family metallohydrolase [Mesorhizobium sp. VK23B]MDX8475970.1 D-Ala-D-Ala carboxypeptidase family metallohydrolase [Mesorhizobium sp. VK23A]